jgi:hypothetical protein
MSGTDKNVCRPVTIRTGDEEFEVPPDLSDRIDRACQIHGYDFETVFLAFCDYGVHHRDDALKPDR